MRNDRLQRIINSLTSMGYYVGTEDNYIFVNLTTKSGKHVSLARHYVEIVDSRFSETEMVELIVRDINDKIKEEF